MDKKAILAVSFGTSYHDTLERTIGAIERELAAVFPDRMLLRAWIQLCESNRRARRFCCCHGP